MRKTAERDRDEELLEQLDEETARLLFPEKFASDTVRVSLVFPPLEGELADDAGEFLAAAEVDHLRDPAAVDDDARVRATFPLARVEELHGLFTLLDSEFGTSELQVLVDGHRLPLVRELWLPLFWTLRD